jgi:RNA-dependent RNA polymerase
LDGAKTGWKVKNETLMGDRRHYLQSLGPKWKAKKQTFTHANTGNLVYLTRSKTSIFVQGAFIMDVLLDAALKEKEQLLGELEKLFTGFPLEPDSDLIRPWNEAQRWAAKEAPGVDTETKQDDLDIIATHVRNVYGKHREDMKSKKPKSSVPGVPFSNLPIEVRQDCMRSISRAFTTFPQVDDLQTIPDQATIARLRASYAFKYDAEQNARKGGWSRFPWNVAMRELCTIKATTLGPSKTVTNNFYEKFRISKIQ